MTAQELIKDIKLANNGYLLMSAMSPAMIKTAIAMGSRHEVTVKDGLVYLPSAKPEMFQSPCSTKAFKFQCDGPDYEAAILDRQATLGLYD